MSTIPRGIRSSPKSTLAGAALLLAAAMGSAHAGPVAEDLFVGSVLVSSTVFPAAAPAERWDERGSASEEFVNRVLLPRTAAAAAAPDQTRQPRDDAASLFVLSVLQPQRGS